MTYDIIKGLVKEKTEKYKDFIVQLGRFHIAQNFWESIGFCPVTTFLIKALLWSVYGNYLNPNALAMEQTCGNYF